ncbi:MAG: flagellar export chaperone FliS [Gammaproteobacteria bacterium]|nr:flagellar export chaperone FliS [Gammaproteobacteria bacterium]
MDTAVNSSVRNTVKKYQQLDVETAIEGANPHQLIEMLFRGARDRINQAQGSIERNDFEGRSRSINACIEIFSGLQASLDHEQGGDIAANLDGLYDYMQRRLFRANSDNDLNALLEVGDLLNTLRTAWASIAPHANVSAG